MTSPGKATNTLRGLSHITSYRRYKSAARRRRNRSVLADAGVSDSTFLTIGHGRANSPKPSRKSVRCSARGGIVASLFHKLKKVKSGSFAVTILLYRKLKAEQSSFAVQIIVVLYLLEWNSRMHPSTLR